MPDILILVVLLENGNQLLGEKTNREVRRPPNFSGPLMLPTRASANSLSAPIKSGGGFRDSLDEKSKANLVQIKGRFSVTSENLDLVKDIPGSSVSCRSSQNGKLPPILRSSENNGSVETSAAERERLLLLKIIELQTRMITMTDELTAEKLKYMQMKQQLTALQSKEQNRDKREEAA
ncbi:unnamed protein product [Sphenostylis stenocarpa]|uniref:Protein kinase superfamily protein n=1 Tax=Sphenostylis stenocarpa TaxID=92480 RepID=A0AA86SZH5_9FABA|nr:unnamed protein product [Sphenostylis stenocarpa]